MTTLARLARGIAALCAFAFLSTSALAQTSYTINAGGSLTLSSADQSGMCGGDMSNRTVYFSNGSIYVLGTNAGGSPISTFKSYIDQGWVVYTHNGDGATVVYITISGDGCNNSRTITVNITQPSTPPSVTLHPQSVAVCDGATHTLRAAASGTPAPTVQWQRSTDNGSTWADETTYPTGTSDTLQLTASSGMDGWRFRAIYTNSAASDTTDAATLTVGATPTITTHPQPASVCTGGSTTLSVSANAGSSPISYQWRLDGTPIAGAQSSTYTISDATTADAGTYDVLVTACGPSIASNGAVVTVAPPPTLSVTLDRTVLTGGTRALMPIVATVSTSGGCSPQVVLDEIISSDPDAGMDAGDIAGDIVVDSLDVTPAETAFQLRAEAGAAGRTYTVIYRLTDGSYTALDTTTVAVLPPGSTLGGAPLPTRFTLDEASPNPATSSTSFSFASNSGANCGGKVVIYATSGLPVKYLQTNYLGAGTTLTWDLTNNADVRVPNGTYIYEVRFCQQIARGAIIVQ